ncbi:MAG: DUF1854 domain-containing protein [Pirellulales bacterium]|nr:DUF1854 domain-containing protein [Pirellulales bacterium]
MNSNNCSIAEFRLEYDSFGRLVLMAADGARHVGVEPVRAFPMTDPQRGLSLVGPDGQELVWIDDPTRLSPQIRETLDHELAAREFAPQILRVLNVSLQVDPCEWEVETDRGTTSFVLRSEEDVRRLDARRALVIDAHGIRYLIPNIQSLDRQSRRILERYL